MSDKNGEIISQMCVKDCLTFHVYQAQKYNKLGKAFFKIISVTP